MEQETFGFFELLTLIGALGFFIFGMKVMSEGIQKIAGNRLRSILSSITNNRLSGIFTGFGITSLIQSSSATTVMLVSFVNAGLLSLRQSIGVIMGANIGTTMTAWLISLLGFAKFSITNYSLPIIAIAFPFLFAKKQKQKYLAEFLIGFALLFMGLGALKASVPELSAEQLSELKSLANMGFVSTLLFVGIGTLLTVIIQSSSAAMALTLALCANGLPVELGAAIVLGENIGTTITANLAALIGNTAAKRSARAHFIFNVFGVVWMLIVFKPFLHGIAGVAENLGWWVNPFQNPYDAGAVTRTLALFHTCFNVINTSLLVWFVPQIERIVIRMVPEKIGQEKTSLKFLSFQLLDTPELAISSARTEMMNFITTVQSMSKRLGDQISNTEEEKFEKAFFRIEKYETEINIYHKDITKFMVKLNQRPLSKEVSRRSQTFIEVSNNLESIGDLIHTISKTLQKERENRGTNPKSIQKNILEFIETSNSQLEVVKAHFEPSTEADVDELLRSYEKTRGIDLFSLTAEIYSEPDDENNSLETGIESARMLMWAEQVNFKIGNILKILAKDPLAQEEESD